MKGIFAITLLFGSSLFTLAQAHYGYGSLTIWNQLPAGTSKDIFISNVIDLDSIKCDHRSWNTKRSCKRNLKCVGDWMLERIKQSYPEKVTSTSEVENLSVVELTRDFPKDSNKRINKLLRESNRHRLRSYLDMPMAKKMREIDLANSRNDRNGTLYSID
jgi:hypothetical protein